MTDSSVQGFDADLTACAAIVEKGDPERFAAVMACPVEARKVLFPLYAFNVEVSRAPWVTQEPMIAEMRLQWWRDALEEIAEGKPVRRHEVVTPLSRVLSSQSAAALDRLVAARRWDIYKEAFEDDAHFDAYLTDTTSCLMQAAASALDAQHEATEQQVAFGRATGLARFLRAVPELEARGRIPLLDGRAEAIGQLARDTLAHLQDRGIRRLRTKARAAYTEGYLTRATLALAVRSPTRVASGALHLAPLRKTYLLWRWS